MLTTASQFGPRARSLRTSHGGVTAHRVLGASSVGVVQHRQQKRDFRFGSWFSHLEPETHDAVRRRQQALKNKYADKINRRLSWDKHSLADDARLAVKRMINRYWMSHDARAGGRYVDDVEPNKRRTMDRNEPVRSGQNIEDVEQAAVEHLVFGRDEEDGGPCSQPSRKRNSQKNIPTPSPHISDSTHEQDDFFIDPVTNRKVPKDKAPNNFEGDGQIHVKDFREYQFRTRLYGDYDKIPSSAELRAYREIDIDANPEDTDTAVGPSGRPEPILHSDDYVQSHGSINGEYKNSQEDTPGAFTSDESQSTHKYIYTPLYKSTLHSGHADVGDLKPGREHLHKYNVVMDEAQAAGPPKLYPDLHKYKPELDKRPVQFQDLKPPEDLAKYNSVVIDEIVARFETDKAPYSDLHNYTPVSDLDAPKQDPWSNHNDLDKYRTHLLDNTVSKQPGETPMAENLDRYTSFRHNESHGKPTGHQVESVEAALHRKNQSVENLEPGDFPLSTVEHLRAKYGTADLRKYTAIRHLELSGKPDSTEEAMSNNSPDLDNYGSVRWNETNGQPLSSTDERAADELSKEYDAEELTKYGPTRWNEPDGSILASSDERVKEALTKKYDPEELEMYTPVYWNEPDGQPIPAADLRVAEGLSKSYDPTELAQYKSVYWNEPDGQPLSSADERVAEGKARADDTKEPAEYGRTKRGNLAECLPLKAAEGPDKVQEDLESYGSGYLWHEPDGKLEPTTAELRNIYTDLRRYGPVTHQEPDGQPLREADTVAEGLEEVDAQRNYDRAERIASEELDSADEPSAEVLTKLRECEAAEKTKQFRHRQMMRSMMEQHQKQSDAMDREASQAVKSAKAKARQVDAKAPSERTLTGNYVRDFPEEFNKSWTETLSKAPSEAVQRDDEFTFQSQRMDGGLEGAFGQPLPSIIQPALDRHSDDRPSMQTHNRELEDGDGCSNVPTYVKHYGSLPASAEESREAASLSATSHNTVGERTLYKILAYDPTMQKVEIAETSSIVPDTTSALTPADALLRLSHPTKFFPHFAPLEAEGYEIVSGSGDVLVFRKVRPETGKPAEQDSGRDGAAWEATEPATVETRINPIDMTGKPRFSPASANFASPTGYVNYDNLPETTASKLPPPPPKIKYNIDVHREEPVFSGPKERPSDGQGGKKSSLGKRLVVGSVWVAGISYALGVVSEFFTTGGVDGTGPKGL